MAFFKAPKDVEDSRKRKKPSGAGMAWGSRSASAAKLNALKDKSQNQPAFNDFGRYFSEKKRKLREQFQADSSGPLSSVAACVGDLTSDYKLGTSSDEKKANNHLFEGVAIFVDGFTKPSHQELRYLMSCFGGVFENYFSKERVTHIICSSLPDSKIINPRLMSKGLPIVKPLWVVDSIKAGKVLPWATYQLERLAYAHPHQRTLSTVLNAPKSNLCTSSKEVETVLSKHMIDIPPGKPGSGTEISGQVCCVSNLIEGRVQVNDHNSFLSKVKDEPSLANYGRPDDITCVEDLAAFEYEQDHAIGSGIDGTHRKSNAIGASGDEQRTKTAVPIDGKHVLGHSTLDDPEFVQNYFKYSRLHFIGTWRTRHQNLAGKSLQEEKSCHVETKVSTSPSPVIIHIDMDCFFVSVVIRNRLDLVGKPVAVCHSNSERGTGEISSANYPARSYGVRAGMFVRDAKACCPDLTIVPYDFPAYEQVAEQVYNILHQHCRKVQTVSCDEAFLDVTGDGDPMRIASTIREDIYKTTHCTASAGIGGNLLLARLATRKAKPNGQHIIPPDEVEKFMADLPVDNIPGVGWALREKLHAREIYTCSQLHCITKDTLQKDFGAKTGEMLWFSAQGIDHRQVQPIQVRKSIGAEVNWGVRFTTMQDAQNFLVSLSNEVSSRMHIASSCGRTFTLKVKRRKDGTGEPAKFMGCGSCDNLSRSATVAYATNSASVLLRISRQLFASLNMEVQEVRGIGLQVTRLQAASPDIKRQDHALDLWLAPVTKVVPSKETTDCTPFNVSVKNAGHMAMGNQSMQAPLPVFSQQEVIVHNIEKKKSSLGKSVQKIDALGLQRRHVNKSIVTSLDIPPLSQLDHTVLECLPNDIISEIRSAYQHLPARPMSSKAEGSLRTLQLPVHETKLHVQEGTGCRKDPASTANPRFIRPKANHVNRKAQPKHEGSQGYIKSLSTNQLGVKHESASNAQELGDVAGLKPGPENYGGPDGLGTQFQISGIDQLIDLPKQAVLLLKDMEVSMNLRNTASVSSALLSLGCHFSGDLVGSRSVFEEVTKKFVVLVTKYVQTVAPRHLEDVYLVLLSLKRLGSRSSMWCTVESLVSHAIKDIIVQLYGGQLP